MTEEKKSGSQKDIRLLVIALVFLTNPIVNIFDYFPDAIGYLIIVKALSYYADRAPYFEEAKSAFFKLGIVSLIKLPAYFIMIEIRSHNTLDNDIKSLVTFTFSVIEVILLVTAIKNLFDAFSYLGERSSADILISPFTISKSGNRLYSPDKLRSFTLIFVIYKALATFLPEMLLLTRGVDVGSYENTFNFAKLYPYTIIISVVSVFVLGIMLTRRYKFFLKKLRSDGDLRSKADELLGDESKRLLDKKVKIRGIKSALSVFIIASFFTLEICFDNFMQINLLPHFIFSGLMILGVARLSRYLIGARAAIISYAAYCAVSVIGYVLQVRFLTGYGYDDLATSTVAKAEYIPVIICSAIEFTVLVLCAVIFARFLAAFVTKHTGIEPDDERYSKTDLEYHRTIKRYVYSHAALAILAGAVELTNTVLRYFADITFVATDGGVGIVTESLLPWFGMIVLAANAIYIGYTLYLFGRLREDTEMKYS